ncbi:hypothetical protein [Streptomyces sp. NPDC005301]|uniref:hypothetical protein n=1 Tax=Streptomyces sp. NPDC005301 TaxID=3156874 RepID=UPI0033BACEA1
MTVTAARRTMSPRRSAARTVAVAALSAAALLGGGLTAQAAAPARTTGGAVELAPVYQLGSYANGSTILAPLGLLGVHRPHHQLSLRVTGTRAEDTVPQPFNRPLPPRPSTLL